MCGRLFEIAKKNVATFAVKNPHLGNQHNDLMNYFSIPMNQHTFAKFVSVYLNMHPSVRETLIRTCGSTLEQEYEKYIDTWETRASSRKVGTFKNESARSANNYKHVTSSHIQEGQVD